MRGPTEPISVWYLNYWDHLLIRFSQTTNRWATNFVPRSSVECPDRFWKLSDFYKASACVTVVRALFKAGHFTGYVQYLHAAQI